MSQLFWSNVGVSVESAAAAAIAITDITNANPAVLTHSGSDPSNGDFVRVRCKGMNQANNRVFRVASAGTGTFELEGLDSTDFGTFTEGTFEVLTFGTSLSTVADVSASGGEAETKDVTTIHDVQRVEVPVLQSAQVFDLTSHFDPSDSALVALDKISAVNGEAAVRYTFATGAVVVFTGYISFAFAPGGSAQDVVTSPLKITARGRTTAYAS